MTFPLELFIRISKYLDKTTRHKLNSIIDYNVCCSNKFKLQNYIGELYINVTGCNICDYTQCSNCYDENKIFFDRCYDCGFIICSKCYDIHENYFNHILISRCYINNCNYCNNIGCLNTKIRKFCQKCSQNYPLLDFNLIY